jgi:hypothetical protein
MGKLRPRKIRELAQDDGMGQDSCLFLMAALKESSMMSCREITGKFTRRSFSKVDRCSQIIRTLSGWDPMILLLSVTGVGQKMEWFGAPGR